ncbi:MULTISPECIES: NAD-dependent epimerase/dehydratase family protein [Micromonospora]|uniref:NAD-dependent epimerase/dehydratase family protein n=1 Tax=Micromonospora TaxID=1873 RepID=UPI0006AF6B8E|nr:NAD(P)-dependent oxidoreductase [Micromonospora sp. NRRL B-16802]KOX03179.1 epimerase [Micromonospora sp. NRRL B-16802]
MARTLGTVALTGAAGAIGTVVRPVLAEHADRLVLLDEQPISDAGPTETARIVDLRDPDAVVAALEDVDCVVHLGGIADEAPLADLLNVNVLGTYHVLEAARRHRLRRVVLASSNRITGFYPADELVHPDWPVRPDGLYGVSKAGIEALGRLYHDKFDTQVVCLRIGSMESAPTEPRHAATWLSPRDCTGFILASLTAPDPGFRTLYAVSDNAKRFWDDAGWAAIGYRPVDNAARHGYGDDPAEGDDVQGGEYASAPYTLRNM